MGPPQGRRLRTETLYSEVLHKENSIALFEEKAKCLRFLFQIIKITLYVKMLLLLIINEGW